MDKKEVSAKIADYLLECKAVRLSPTDAFTWTSGLRSPIYCDNRVTLSYPEIRTYITKVLSDAIQTYYSGAEAIVGVATAGIPQGALIAAELNLPFAYIRSEPKKHGMKNAIEGHLEPGSKVVVVEDLISTGKSSLKAVMDLRVEGMKDIGLVSIFNYGFKETHQKFLDANCSYASLCDFSTLAERALSTDYINKEEHAAISDWNADAALWSEKYSSGNSPA